MSCRHALQVHCDSHKVESPVYSVTRSGPDHVPTFQSTVTCLGFTATGGRFPNLRSANESAAFLVISHFYELGIDMRYPFSLKLVNVLQKKFPSSVHTFSDVRLGGPDHQPLYKSSIKIGSEIFVEEGVGKNGARDKLARRVLALDAFSPALL